nr:uncharacterized protein LOC110380165 [Helicoverpa armigera]
MIVVMLFLLPLQADARITINVTISSDETDMKVNISYKGNHDKVVTDEELKLFNITYPRLNKGLRVELGKVPNDVFLKNPTPYGDLFEKFHWEPMKRRLTVKKTKILDIITEDVVLGSHEYINKATTSIKSKRTMNTTVINQFSSTWSKTGLPDSEILTNYTMIFDYGNHTYVNKWRNESTKAAKMTIGVTKEGLITIKPKTTVVTKLIASKTIVLVELLYEAKLVGSIIANYAEVYGKYHFWAPSVKSIMKAGNMTNEVLTTEILEIRCFTNPRLQVYDKLTGKIVEPPKVKRPLMKILKNKNTTRVIYITTEKPKPKNFLWFKVF